MIKSATSRKHFIKSISNKHVFFLSASSLFSAAGNKRKEDSTCKQGTALYAIEEVICTLTKSTKQSVQCCKYWVLHSASRDPKDPPCYPTHCCSSPSDCTKPTNKSLTSNWHEGDEGQAKANCP